MLALIGCILAVLAYFGVDPAGLSLLPLALAFVAAHLAVGPLIALPAFRRSE
jgi:hypothetical protein